MERLMQDYIVKQGDILGRIAQQFNISLQDLLKLNREAGNEIKDPDIIKVGQIIKVPGGTTTSGDKKPTKTTKDQTQQKRPDITEKEFLEYYLSAAVLEAMENSDYLTRQTMPAVSAKKLGLKQPDPGSDIMPKIRKALNQLDPFVTADVYEPLREKLFDKLEAIDEVGVYFSYDNPEAMMDNFKFQPKPGREAEFFGEDLRTMSLLELGVAYGTDLLPSATPAEEGAESASPSREMMLQALKKSERIRIGLDLGGKPEPYNKSAAARDQNYNAAWQKAAIEYQRNLRENKIIQEYILKNTPQQQPEDISIIEIIADEVNKTLNNLPEVQIASEILNEDELKDLFSPIAKQVVIKVRGQIEEEIKKLVELEINATQLKNAVSQRIASEGEDSITEREKEVLLANFTQEELEAAGIEFEVTDVDGTGDPEDL